MSQDKLIIAKIVKPQGIRGELKVIAMTDSPNDLTLFDRVYVGGNAYKLLKVRPQSGDCAFITLGGVADRNAAELLRDMDVEALREDAPALPEGRYYIVDVIGCSLVGDDGAALGTVKEITPARTDVYEVEKAGGGKLVFPAVEGVIKNIDLIARQVTVDVKRLAEVAMEEK